ncbi:MAG TPA: hypothetical protein VEH06_12630 [Candidatus Bathyarchaeia archaeon]|nr:hypothetical protein [Candidatus Bathyarchaeia archaeon]
MIWSLQPDNESRYPPRFKVVLDYFGLVRAVDDKAVRIAAAEVMRKHPERDEDKVIEYQRH